MTSHDIARLEILARQANDELVNRIVPFWLALEDKSQGGHFSSVDFNGEIDRHGKKSAVFVARLLFFSPKFTALSASPRPQPMQREPSVSYSIDWKIVSMAGFSGR
jgi:mannose/cellobiose epimerase-like protein (N-acyl-D-glucosamine 2-epimerase family)